MKTTDKTGAVMIPAEPLQETLDFLESLGFVLRMIMPADAPCAALVSGHGLTLRLDPECAERESVVMIPGISAPLRAPNGTEFRPLPNAPAIPPLRCSLQIARETSDNFIDGRAGMRYRDLLPDRQGGRFVASHIRLENDGPVADYVHYHRIAFQMIYCLKGSATLVYEDQGDPFVFRAGDCVLQPPGIRHRVLSSEGGLEVIEVGSPAVHETWRDHQLALPNAHQPGRKYSGQRFVLHRHDDGPDFGFMEATSGMAQAGIANTEHRQRIIHDDELQLRYLLSGSTLLKADDSEFSLHIGDAFCIPRGATCELQGRATLLEVIIHRTPCELPEIN